MFKSVYFFEFKRLWKQPAVIMYFLTFFGLALVLMLGTAGFFDGTPKNENSLRLLNSAYEIHTLLLYFNSFFLFLLPALIGMVGFSDFKDRIFPILFSYPLKKSDYVFGKFFSALTVVLLITLSVGIAFLMAESILGQDHPMIGPSRFSGYATAYLLFLFPNMLLYGFTVFLVVALTRNVYSGFIAIILLLLLRSVIESLFSENHLLLALFDPFGQSAISYETRFWTLAEQNTKEITVRGMVMWNRLFWTMLMTSLCGVLYSQFQLRQDSFSFFNGIRSASKVKKRSKSRSEEVDFSQTEVALHFSFFSHCNAMLKLTVIEIRSIITNKQFPIFLIFGILALVFAMSRVTNRSDLLLLPLTRIVLSVPMIFFTTVITLLTFVYSGMVVHRARIAHLHQLVDATATENWVLLGSKMLALVTLQAALLLIMILSGIGLQVYNGYHHFELGLYFFHVFVLIFPTLIIWAVFSIFVHTVIPNMYAGFFFLLLTWLAKDQLPTIGIESYLLRFNAPPYVNYSDLNGFGHGLWANLLINAYWLSFSAVLIVISLLFWERGFSHSLVEKLTRAKQRIHSPVLIFGGVVVSIFGMLGFTIYSEENSSLKSVGNDSSALHNFRAHFGRYTSTVQPKIVSVKLRMDLFPEVNSFEAQGEYLIVNTSVNTIDTLLIKTGFDEITEFTFDVESQRIQSDEKMKFSVHTLESSLLPGDTLTMCFNIRNKSNSLFYQNSSVLNNGTFLKTDILPRLGYPFNNEVKPPTDSVVKFLNFYSADADVVDIETIIGTHPLQTAIAPGALVKKWAENGRTYFHYKTEEKIKFAFAFNSGVFSKSATKHNGIDVEILHHNNHTENLAEMAEGLKMALDYNTHYFGPYQHSQLRVVEFPHSEGTYATVLGTSIPTSEIRFVHKNEPSDGKVNLPFYIQAHEVTHHWWGNQLIPAEAQGAKMLTESIAEYISLRIYEQHVGEEKARHFLSLQRRRYLQGRARESGVEQPLFLVQPDQEYIAYGKGVLALNALQCLVGEEHLNYVLKEFLEKFKTPTSQYPTTLDFLTHLKSAILHKFHYIVSDMMESITFFENEILETRMLSANQTEITLRLKRNVSQTTSESDAANVVVEIGQLDEHGKMLRVEKHSVSLGKSKIVLTRAENATTIVLDPHFHFIEFDVENNRKQLF